MEGGVPQTGDFGLGEKKDGLGGRLGWLGPSQPQSVREKKRGSGGGGPVRRLASRGWPPGCGRGSRPRPARIPAPASRGDSLRGAWGGRAGRGGGGISCWTPIPSGLGGALEMKSPARPCFRWFVGGWTTSRPPPVVDPDGGGGGDTGLFLANPCWGPHFGDLERKQLPVDWIRFLPPPLMTPHDTPTSNVIS